MPTNAFGPPNHTYLTFQSPNHTTQPTNQFAAALFTGCTFTSSLLFVNVVGVGDAVGIFGGNAVFTGCAWTFNCALVAGYGVGFMMFVGGGTVILTGVSGVNNMGANAFFGSGCVVVSVSVSVSVSVFRSDRRHRSARALTD